MLVALAYLCFVVYGSLVPLKFRPMPLDAALDAFSRISYLDLGIDSRADWVANILLFIPFAFFWTGVLGSGRPGASRVWASIAVFFGAVALSVSIEFAQLFFPPRTVSINDILAEGLGAAIGIALWWLTGHRLIRWVESLPRARGVRAIAERALAVYLLLLFGYNLLPLDLTLSPVEIYRKWREGRVLWLPFSAPYANPAQFVYDLLTDIAIWVPAAMLWARSYTTSAKRIWWYVVGAALTLELLQLFVYSRVSDVTDILTASMGGAIGVWLARALQANQSPPSDSAARNDRGHAGTAAWLVLAGWLAVLLVVFWYPFDFNFDSTSLRDRLDASHRVPFEALYFGTEFRAVTEVFHKAGFMFPLGVLLGWAVADSGGLLPSRLVRAAAALFILLVALAIETGQLFLPGKIADLTDVLLEFGGGWLGLILGMRLRAIGNAETAPANSHRFLQAEPVQPPISTPASDPRRVVRQSGRLVAWAGDLGAVTVLAVLLLIAAKLPGVPYNVHELFRPGALGFLTAAGLAGVLWWLLTWPLLILDRWRSRPELALWLLPCLPWLGLPPALMLWATVPQESLADIVGSPVLGWVEPLEFVLRYLALHAVLALAATGAVWLVAGVAARQRHELLPRWFVVAVLWAWPLHVAVVEFAATDNLTELMRGGGSFLASVTLFCGALALFTAAFAAASAIAGAPARGRLTIVAVLTWSLSAVCLWFGSEPYVLKYGRVFSAAQFLLSSDRDHYASVLVIWSRFGFLSLGLVAVALLLQGPRWRRLAAPATAQSSSVGPFSLRR